MRSPPTLILRAKIVDDVGLELSLYVKDVVGNAQGPTHHPGILNIVKGATTTIIRGQVGVVKTVELHRHSNNIITLLLKQ
jgi:hypothetical protein